jgi:hypothetical protein
MIEVKVFGTTPPCARCTQAERLARQAAAQFGDQVKVTKLDALSPEGDKYPIISTPTVVIDEKIFTVGEVPTQAAIADAIKKALGG